MAINSYWMIVKMRVNALLPQSDCSVWDLKCIGTLRQRAGLLQCDRSMW